jgi:hypothetical protein
MASNFTEKFSNIRLHKNLFNGSEGIPYRQSEVHRHSMQMQTVLKMNKDMMYVTDLKCTHTTHKQIKLPGVLR